MVKSIDLGELNIINNLSKVKSKENIETNQKPKLVNFGNNTIRQFHQPIVYTLKEYESIYENRLAEHIKIHVDYDAKHFILQEINEYEFYVKLIDSIGCVPDNIINEKHKFPIINIADFDYHNLYFRGNAMDDFFYKSEENTKGYVIIEEIRPDVMNVINLFKNLTFDEFIFKSHNLKNSFRLIIKFLKQKRKGDNLNKGENRQIIEDKNIDAQFIKPKKIPEKWYALLYWIELKIKGEIPPTNREGAFIKSEIQDIGRLMTKTTGQSFYRQFIDIDLNNKRDIDLTFGNNWKKTIIELSKDNESVIEYIKDNYS